MTNKTGKVNANRPIGKGSDSRPHGTKWKTGVHGVLKPEMVKKLASQAMTLAEIGYFHGCSKENIHYAINADSELLQAWNEGLTQAIEKATSCLMRNIEKDNTLAAMFLLKYKHLPGEKGWCEQQHKEKEVDPDHSPRVEIFLPHNFRNDPPNGFSVKDGSED